MIKSGDLQLNNSSRIQYKLNTYTNTTNHNANYEALSITHSHYTIPVPSTNFGKVINMSAAGTYLYSLLT